MPMADGLIQGLLKLFLENVAFSNVGDVSGLQGSAAAGDFWLALHTADPGSGGSQSTSEVGYGGYARVNLARVGASFTIAGNVFSLAANLDFPACTSGSATAAYASIGSASSGAGHLWWTGAIAPNISIVTGVIPVLTAASTFTLS